MGRLRRGDGALARATLLYAAVAAVLFRDLIPRAATHLYSDLYDPLLNTAILAWNARVLPLTEAWWNFPSFAPLTGVTSFTEHLLLTYPVASPVIWFTGNPVLAYNVVFLLAAPLNGAAAFALARELTGSRAAAVIGGLAYAFAPYQSAHLSHLQHMTTFGMPIGLLCLHRYLRTGGRAALLGFAGGWLACALASSALLVFFPILALLWCVWFLRSEWRRLLHVAAAGTAVMALVAPLLWGYHVRHAMHGIVRSHEEIRRLSADLTGLFGMYHRALPWYGVLPHDFDEGALFPGLTIAVLAGIALVAALRAGTSPWSRRLGRAFALLTLVVVARVWTGPWGWHIGPIPLPPFSPYMLFTPAVVLLIASVLISPAYRDAWRSCDVVVFYATAAVVMWAMALGPVPEWSTPWRALVAGPYRLLLEMPGVDSIRVPARAWFAAALCLSVLSAFGMRALVLRYPHYARTLVPALALLIVVEGAHIDGLVEVPSEPRLVPPDVLSLTLPIDEGGSNALPQYRAVRGGYRTINGYSGWEPPHFYPLRRTMADQRPGALDDYLAREDLYVIIRPGTDPSHAVWIRAHAGAERAYQREGVQVVRIPRLRESSRKKAIGVENTLNGG